MEPKRVAALRKKLVKLIPRIPNNKETQALVEQMPLGKLLICHFNWRSRFITSRQRKVNIEPSVTANPKWKMLKEDVGRLLDKFRKGEDVTSHLSKKIISHGIVFNDESRWEDKDFLLNVMGFHHLHLGGNLDDKGFVERTNSVLFVEVKYDHVNVIDIFDHSVFEFFREDESFNDERKRLWTIFDERSRQGLPPGSIYASTSITTAGTHLRFTNLSIAFVKRIREVEKDLEDPSYLRKVFGVDAGYDVKKIKPEWMVRDFDLGLYDKKLNVFGCFIYGER